MRSRLLVFTAAAIVGGAIGSLWNLPVFGNMYKAFIRLFMDPAAPLGPASAAVALAFVMGVPRICAP
jgi:hypothetical protein